MSTAPLRLAITTGEPAGIGPDICLAAQQLQQTHQLILIGDEQLLKDRAAALGLPAELPHFDPQAEAVAGAFLQGEWSPERL